MSDDKDTVWQRDEIDSPCIQVCVIHQAAGLCTGCFRTLEEIGEWSAMTPAERKDIMQALPDRAGELKKRRGGRKARRR